jgi:hypothetical protein
LTTQETDPSLATSRCKFLLLLLLVCAALFGLYHLLQMSKAEDAAKRVVISAADIAHMREAWTAQRGTPPSSAQIGDMIEAAVRERLLFREALTLKLEHDDAIVRRRLAQRMELRLRDASATAKPTDAELAEFLQNNAERFEVPAKVGFSHIYFNHKNDRLRAKADAEKVLSAIRARKHPPERAPERGERFMLPSDYAPKSRQELAELFGPQFVNEVFALSPGQWEGPIASSHGYHLVRVTERTEPRKPTLDEVHDRVAADLTASRRRDAEAAQYAALRARYKIVVEDGVPDTRGRR